MLKVKDKSGAKKAEKRNGLLTLFSIKPHDCCHIWAFLRYAVAREDCKNKVVNHMQSRVSTVLQDGANYTSPDRLVSARRLREDNERLTVEVNRLRLELLDLEHKADTDPLVPIYNRRAFMREVNRAKTVMSRYDILSSVIFFDLNGFKSINDRFGHAIGDQLLRQVGDVLLSGVRSCDLVARLGGDEFGVLLFKSDVAAAKAKGAALACRIAEQMVELPTGNITISAAWGVAPCESDDTADQILARADRNMYVAKRAR